MSNTTVLKLQGLSCPTCGKKIEEQVTKINNISTSNLNFLTNELTLNHSISNNTTLVTKVQSLVNSIEKGIVVQLPEEVEDNASLINKKELAIFFIGLSIYTLGFFVKDMPYHLVLNVIAYFIIGYNVLEIALKNILKGDIFDENFLMMIATIGAFIVGSYGEAVAVMIFYKVGEFFQDLAVNKSKNSIKALLKLKPDKANLLIGSEVKVVQPEDLKVQDRIIVKVGEKVPVDGIVEKGTTFFDTSAITGESNPVKISVGNEVISGSINLNAVIEVKVTSSYNNSTVAKIIDLVNKAYENKGETEKFITKFARLYTPIVVLIAFLTSTLVPFLTDGDYLGWFYKACVFLIISCPCALVVSVPLTFFSAIGTGAKEGILFKSSAFIEKLGNVTTIAFDKTGTLTKGVFTVTKENIFSDDFLPILIGLEKNSNHPISSAILKNYEVNNYKELVVENGEEIAGKGLSGIINGKVALAGNIKLMEEHNISVHKYDGFGTVIYVAYDNKFIGYIALSDVIKKESEIAIKKLKEKGKTTVMVTGDNESVAVAVKEKLQIDNVYYNLLKDCKVKVLKELYNTGKKEIIAFVGDGINDAPALATADIGIAMGEAGSDITIESADLVINDDNPEKILKAISISKNTINIAYMNIFFSIGIKILILLLSIVGIANMWLAVFADVGVTLIAIFNAMRKK